MIVKELGKIDSGDNIDINNISSMGPICNMLLVDNKMKKRIKELSIDRDYGFKVFSISDLKN